MSDEPRKPIKVKHSRVMKAAADLARADERHRKLRTDLRECEREVKRALSLMKRLTAPPRRAPGRPSFRSVSSGAPK